MLETGISVECRVGKGTFMSEYYVKIECGNRILWEGTIDREMVFDLEEVPSGDRFVDGRLYAYLISYNAVEALIELPVENPLVGRRVSVPIQCVRKEKIPA